jgi:predicted anti-sigma-YlaC factor YlaD
MNVPREVIVDLLPVYLAGEASAATSALIEEYLRQDPELAEQVRRQRVDNLGTVPPSILSPDVELRALRRARVLIGWQRWLFGFGISFTAVACTAKSTPAIAGLFLVAAGCWIGYYSLRRRLRVRC